MGDKIYEPVIKWSGSKRSQADTILSYFPNKIDTYYEPFCGGASVLRRLIESDINVSNYVCSDINNDLILLWNAIKNNPDAVSSHYMCLWTELNVDDNKERKKQYYYKVRERFNKEKSPLDFMFIMRTAVNGMPRYNKNGEFNNSFHITRNGILPDKLDVIIREWSKILNNNNVIFKCCSYDEIHPTSKDFCYLDPPYANTKGMYYGIIDYNSFWDWIRSIKCKYILSFDGISGNTDNTYKVPDDIYNKHEYILSGNSSFRMIIGKSNNSIVYDSLYIG